MDVGMFFLFEEVRYNIGEFFYVDWEVMKIYVEIGIDLVE